MMTVRSATALALAALLPVQTLAQAPAFKPCTEPAPASPDIDRIVSLFKSARSEGASAPRSARVGLPALLRTQSFDGRKGMVLQGDDRMVPVQATTKGKPAGTAVERLISAVEASGQIRQSRDGSTLKVMPPVNEETETSQTVYAAGLKGKVDAKGNFTRESLILVRQQQGVTQEELKTGQTRGEQIQSSTQIEAGLDGKVTKMKFYNSVHIDLVKKEELTAAQAEADYKADLAATLKAFSVADVKALIAKVQADGEINPFAGASVLQAEETTEADGAKVGRAALLTLEVKNGSLEPSGLVLARNSENFKETKNGTVTTQKGPKVQVNYKVGLDGALGSAVKVSVEHSLVTDQGEKAAGDEGAQKTFDAIVEKLAK